MKILILTNVPAPYRIDFFNCIGKKCDLTVLFEQSAEEQTHRNQNWFTEHANSYVSINLKGKPFIHKTISFETLQYLKDSQYDLVLIMGYSLPTEIISIIYMVVHKKRYVLCFDGAIDKPNNWYMTLLKKFLIGNAYAYLSTGGETDRYIKKYAKRKPLTYRIPFSSLHQRDILKFPPSSEEKAVLKEKLELKEEKIILSVGQFIYRKGYDVLIKSMDLLDKSYGLYIVGDQATPEYIELCKKYGLNNIHFIGYKTKQELREYYLAADVFVLPTREDVWGLVINEAMAYGLPTITTDGCVAGIELIKPTQPECIVAVDNVEQLADAIALLFSNKEKLKTLGQENIQIIRNWTIEDMVESYLNIFESILKKEKEND